MSWSTRQVRTATTALPWTKDFRHLQSFPRHWLKRFSFADQNIKAARVKDRIKYWNIVPGDQVRVRGDESGRILEVSRINKLTNRVYLKGMGETSSSRSGVKNVHYSRCQLFIGNHELPPKGTANEPRVVPVFATRLGTSQPHWLPTHHRYEWDRFAAATTPRLPTQTHQTDRVRIPWPKVEEPVRAQPTRYDTTAEAVTAITYKPFALPSTLKAPVPQLAYEKGYIQSLFNPQARSFDASAPVEVHLHKELSNPHGRAKKQARWQARRAWRQTLLLEYVRAEMKDLKGRTRAEARAEGTWKWSQRLVDDRADERRRRWKSRGAQTRMERRKVRKERKAVKEGERLKRLVLHEAPNQVVPQPQH